jgi:hypothetical protein
MTNIDIELKTKNGWKTIESYLPEDYEALAKRHKVLEVQHGEAKITSAQELLRLIMLHAGADLGLRQTVSLMAESGGVQVSHVTLHKKMRLSGPYLKALVAKLTQCERACPERWAGYEVVVVDGSSFCGPGAQSTDARLHLQLRLSDLDIMAVAIEDYSVGESFKRFEWKPGQLALGDRGYANPPGVLSVVEQGADVLVRVNRSSLPMATPSNERVQLMAWLRLLKGHAVEQKRVSVFSREHNRGVDGRLIAMRLPAAEAEKARARVRRELGAETKAEDLEAAQYVVLFTTVSESRMSAHMCLELYRLRWQVELAFKRWKSLCHFDRLPNYRDDTIISWLYAKLLLAVVMHRMAGGGASFFFPEYPGDERSLADLDALEDSQHRMADAGRRALAA